ncbi:ABC transporter permease [Kribbella sp. CA-253562]|uniref:ABC transporter permease n=1 Tax=Kribbella sp. CA-253562 TaxID=3239942 RepID=UPI003D949244
MTNIPRPISGAVMPGATTVLISAAVVLGWSGVARAELVPRYILPAPAAVFAAAAEHREALLTNTYATGKAAALGLALSIAVGLPLGVLIAESRVARRIMLGPLVAFQSVPKIALAPLLIVMLGFGIGPKVVLAMLVVFFPITMSTIVGVGSTTAAMRHLAGSMGLSRRRYLWHMALPAAAPHIAAGIHTTASLAVAGAVVAEFVGSAQGLGNLLLIASGNHQTPLAFAALCAIALVGVSCYVLATLVTALATAALGPRHTKER